MARVRVVSVGLLVLGLLVMVSTASAQGVTLGTTAIPFGATMTPCAVATTFYAQSALDSSASYSYVIPYGGGEITSWSTNATQDSGGSLTLLILRPGGAGYTLVGSDTETIPSPLAAGGVATFNLIHPIVVSGGDVVGLTSPLYSGVMCSFSGGSNIPSDDLVGSGQVPYPSYQGAMYDLTGTTNGALLNLSVDINESQNVTVLAASAPSSVTVGNVAVYGFTVINDGPGDGYITFGDTVPAGLTVISAVAGAGSCSSGPGGASCSIQGLEPGSAAPVIINVLATSAGRYANTATVYPFSTTTSTSSSSATAMLTVTSPPATPPASCKTVSLAGTPLAIAKTVIRELNCTVGKITKRHSKAVHNGDVLATSPGPGRTLAAGTPVRLIVSSGRPKPRRRKRRR